MKTKGNKLPLEKLEIPTLFASIYTDGCWHDIPAPQIISILGDPTTIKIITPPDVPAEVTLNLLQKIEGDGDFEVIETNLTSGTVVIITQIQNCNRYIYQWATA